MAAGDITPTYGSPGTFTITLASLATSSTKLVGRESTLLDVDALNCTDVLLGGKITTGTTPTTAKSIEVWAVAPLDGTPTWPDVFDGTDSAETLTAELKASLCKLVASMATTGTSDVTYAFSGISLASLFGGVLPSDVVLFVTHDTAVNLNATGGNHVLYYQPITMNVAS